MAASPGDGASAEGATTKRCPHCGSALDDVATMTDRQVLEALRTEMYRDALRMMRSGDATHQEKAIARGILRDNKMVAEDNADPEEGPVSIGEETYDFSSKSMQETEGG
jgi:hypothetical protein